jgi:hypothetical protein
LFFAIKTGANPPAAQNTAAPVAPTTAQNPEALPTITPQRPPQCTFPLAQTTTTESTPEEYTFSESQVVLTADGSIIEIVEWLPDNQRVLITQEIRDNTQQTIELYNLWC